MPLGERMSQRECHWGEGLDVHGQVGEAQHVADLGVALAHGRVVGDIEAEETAEAADDAEADDRDWRGQRAFSVSSFLRRVLDLQRDRQMRTSSFCHVAIFRGSAAPSQPAVTINCSLKPDKPRGSAVGAGM